MLLFGLLPSSAKSVLFSLSVSSLNVAFDYSESLWLVLTSVKCHRSGPKILRSLMQSVTNLKSVLTWSFNAIPHKFSAGPHDIRLLIGWMTASSTKCTRFSSGSKGPGCNSNSRNHENARSSTSAIVTYHPRLLVGRDFEIQLCFFNLLSHMWKNASYL